MVESVSTAAVTSVLNTDELIRCAGLRVAPSLARCVSQVADIHGIRSVEEAVASAVFDVLETSLIGIRGEIDIEGLINIVSGLLKGSSKTTLCVLKSSVPNKNKKTNTKHRTRKIRKLFVSNCASSS